MIDGDKSLLPLVVFDAAHGWKDLLKLGDPEIEQGGLDRLEETLKASVITVAVERHYLDKDYRDTFSNFHSKKFSTPSSRCVRLHFFTASLSRADLRDASKLQAV